MKWRDLVVEVCFWVLAAFAVMGCTTVLMIVTGWPLVLLLIISVIIVPGILIGGSLTRDYVSEAHFYLLAVLAFIGCGGVLHVNTDWNIMVITVLSIAICSVIYGIGAVLSDAPDYEGN